ncbi:MAG: MBL fold metallo-hydrolase, partial [Actinobacteria bacterium]|nr:MBL fold metallo-hydrolase [Actinomycetota bacterium]
MLVERTEHPSWLSNAYLVADGPGGHGVLVDSNGINEPLLDRAERDRITITHVLVTHSHADHVVTCAQDADRLGVPVVGHPLAKEAGVRIDETVQDGDVLQSGSVEVRTIATPGHCLDHLAFLVNGTDCLTADCLFRGTVGGTVGGGPSGYADQVRSIMERLMSLPPATRVHPGHKEPTTIGAEWEGNPFVRVWRGLDPEGSEPCRVG